MSDDDEAVDAIAHLAKTVSVPDFSTVLREYLGLYERQEPRRAELVVPAWAYRHLYALPEEQRRRIMGEIDHVAASYGLQTPTKIIVAAPPT